MGEIPRASAIRGQTIRFIWTDGPTQGKTHEHVFHEDGMVDWREVAADDRPAAATAKGKAAQEKGTVERVAYAALEAGTDVYAVSYLARSGYTLTVVLDFKTRRLVGIASGGTTWAPLQGRFEVVS